MFQAAPARPRALEPLSGDLLLVATAPPEGAPFAADVVGFGWQSPSARFHDHPEEGSAGGSIRVGLDGRIDASITMGLEGRDLPPLITFTAVDETADADVEACPPHFEGLSLFAQTTTSHLRLTLQISAAPD